MSSSPFVRDMAERAGRGGVYAGASYGFEAWLNTLVVLTMSERALVFAAANMACSVAGSLLFRRFELTSKGLRRVDKTHATASLIPEVEYVAPSHR